MTTFLPFSSRAKDWEPIGLELRHLLGLPAADELDPWVLAPKVGLRVIDGRAAIATLGSDHKAHLLRDGRPCWSGGVYPKPLPDGSFLCILNPTHSRRRNKITLMEEIVHAYRRHRPSELVFDEDGLAVRQYDAAQEDEAYGVGAAALLPWQTFFRGLNTGRTANDLAEDYDVTPALVTYRIKVTGAHSLYRARQRRHV